MRAGKGNRLKKSKGQSIIEYSVLLGLLVTVFVGMQAYLKRGIQAGIRISADQLGNQEDGFAEVDAREGSVEKIGNSKTTTLEPTLTKEIVSRGGKHTKDTREVKATKSESVSERKDDGGYYVPVGRGLELRRQKD